MRDSFEDGKIFVGGLSQDTTKETMRRHFAEFGNITDCVVMLDKGTGRSRGFGFVTFDNTDAIDAVLATKQVIDTKEVDCKRACPRESMSHNNLDHRIGLGFNNSVHTDKIFVGGLPDVTTEEFKQYFEKFGRVTDAVLMHDKASNRPRGFGFVTFENPKVVDDVVRQYSSHQLHGKWVEVKKATPKEQMIKPSRDNMGPPGMYGGSPGYHKWNYNGYGLDHRVGGNMYGMYLNSPPFYDSYQGHDSYGQAPRGRYDYPHGPNGKNFAYGNSSGYNPMGASSHKLNMGGSHSTYDGPMNSSNLGYGHYNNNGPVHGGTMFPSHGPQRGNRPNVFGRSNPY